MTQESTDPPVFVFFCRGARFVSENYRRYLARKIREEYGFEGVSLKLLFRENREEDR
jgi:GTP-binding protein